MFFFQEPGGANACTPLASRDTSDRLRVHRSTAILCSLSKTDRVVLITSSPSGYTPLRPECPDAPLSSCLLIKMWQRTKAHGVTRNEPKIHVICYITICHKTKPNQIKYEVHTISFQTFLVWAFKIVVDSWNDWPISMISVSDEQLQQQLEYTLLSPDCHS